MLSKYIAQQFEKPTGICGVLLTSIMNWQNRQQYESVSDNINIQANDTILDVGFGNGHMIKKLLRHNPKKIFGIDISKDMLARVGRKYASSIASGLLDVQLADIKNLPFTDSSFDKIYTINTLYFWTDTVSSFSEIKRTLKPDGIFLNVLYVKEFLDKISHTRYGYSKYTIEQITDMTKKSGLKVTRIIEIQPNASFCIIAKK